MIQTVAAPKKSAKKADGRNNRLGAHKPEDIALLAKKLRNCATKLDAIAFAMTNNEVEEVMADGAGMAERGITHLNNFAGHLIRALANNPDVEFNLGKVE